MRIGVFLVGAGSLYQRQQEQAATAAARTAQLELDVFMAEGDGKKQRDQLFGYLRTETPPAGLVLHAVDEAGLRFVAQEAQRKGCAWVMVNRSPDWVAELRRQAPGLAFCVTPDQKGIGRLQGEQIRTLLPRGGTLLYVTGPPSAKSARERQEGLEETRGPLVSVVSVIADWSEAGAREAVRAWMETTRGLVPIHAIAAQNDDMALGASVALTGAAASFGKLEWRKLPVVGVDGLPDYGQRLVKEGTLAATVVMPVTAGIAVDLLAKALRGAPLPPQVTSIPVASFPELAQLKPGA